MFLFHYIAFASLYCACLSSHYTFYRQMVKHNVSRSLDDMTGMCKMLSDEELNSLEGNMTKYHRKSFGGSPAVINEFPLVVVLLNRYWSSLCTGAALTSMWVVTTAHCVTDEVAYVKYNTRIPQSADGDAVSVLYLYAHPDFHIKFKEDDKGNKDIQHLYHDIGLIRTRTPMYGLKQNVPSSIETVFDKLQMTSMDIKDSIHRVLTAYGYTSGDSPSSRERLHSIRLQMSACKRDTWQNCTCLIPEDKDVYSLCSMDSGGPVVHEGMQVAIVSMGPGDCAERRTLAFNEVVVVVELSKYIDVINKTVLDTEGKLSTKRAERSRNSSTSLTVSMRFILYMFVSVTKSIYACI